MSCGLRETMTGMVRSVGRTAAVLAMAATIGVASLSECMSGVVANTHMACCTAMQHDCHANAAVSDCCPSESQHHRAVGPAKQVQDLDPDFEIVFESPAATVDLTAAPAWLPPSDLAGPRVRFEPPPVYLLHAALLI